MHFCTVRQRLGSVGACFELSVLAYPITDELGLSQKKEGGLKGQSPGGSTSKVSWSSSKYPVLAGDTCEK